MANFRKYTLIPFKDENTEAARQRVDAILGDKSLLPHEKLALTDDMRGRMKDYEAQKAPPVVETRPSKEESDARSAEFTEMRDMLKEMLTLLQRHQVETIPAGFTTTLPSSVRKSVLPKIPTNQAEIDTDDKGDHPPPAKKKNYFLEYLEQRKQEKQLAESSNRKRSAVNTPSSLQPNLWSST